MGPAAVVVVSVPWRMGVVLVMRWRRVLMSRRVMPRVVMTVRGRRVHVPWRMVAFVMVVVRVEPTVIVMTPRGPVGVYAAVVDTQGMPLAGAVRRRLRPLGERDAA